jgi:hypothetical protein
VPFPLLAHQAPLLPLKLWRPRLFSAVALCFGSVAPDLEYLLEPKTPGFLHSAVGQVVACLPVSIVVTWLMAVCVGPALASKLPRSARWRVEDLGSATNPFSSFRAFALVVSSALLGGYCHIFLDAFTHPRSWACRKFPSLQRTVLLLGKPMQLTLALQLGLSVLGMLLALPMIDHLLRRKPGEVLPVYSEPPRPGMGMLVDVTVGFMAAAVAASSRVAGNPVLYFEVGSIYVWGYIAFRAWCAGLVGITFAALLTPAGQAPTVPDSSRT